MIVGLSIHPVLLGLVLSYVFGHRLNVLPARGYCSVNNLSTGCDGLARWAEHLILPWITFGVVNAALFTMMIRALVIEELNEEYVRTARAKGAGQGAHRARAPAAERDAAARDDDRRAGRDVARRCRVHRDGVRPAGARRHVAAGGAAT